jgi:hypothetical protein
MKTSTDLEQQFSAAFKADNSRQAQTCLQAFLFHHLATVQFHHHFLNGIFNDLETLPLEKHARHFVQAFSPGG